MFKVKKEKLIVKPVMRQRNALITDPNHEAFFLFGTATNTYCLPVDRQGNLVDPFENEEEKEWLESMLDLDLNHHKRKENYFHRHTVKLGKDNRVLDLSNPKDYLDYVILRANKKFIAPDGDSAMKLATYRYMLTREDYESNSRAKTAELEIDAYIALGDLKRDNEAMINFLKIYGKKVAKESKAEFLISELKAIIDKDPSEFLAIYNDKDSEIKLLISEAVEAGAVHKKGRKYYLPGGDELCGSGDVPTLNVVVEYLKSPANQDLLLSIKARVEKFKD